MPIPDEVTEDRGLKALFTTYPEETVEVFAPELLRERGEPLVVEALAQEHPLPDLGDPSRFLDIALRATWADGFQAVILLIEHWSEARRVDLPRVLWYYAAVRLQNPGAEVLPLLLVTEPDAGQIPGVLQSTIAGFRVLDFQTRVVQIGPEDLPRLRQLQNHVAAMMLSLALRQVDAVAAAVAAVVALARMPGSADDLRRFLPLAVKLARIRDSELPRFYAQLREDPVMVTIFDEVQARGESRGESRGKTEGAVATLRDLVAQGILSVDAARAEIRRLVANGVIPEPAGTEAINRLG